MPQAGNLRHPHYPRACLKIHSRHLYAPLRGIFGPNSVNVARYASLIGTKSPTKWDAQLTESNFQTHPKANIHAAVELDWSKSIKLDIYNTPLR